MGQDDERLMSATPSVRIHPSCAGNGRKGSSKAFQGNIMKIIVDKSKCVGHAMCAAAAPEVFELDELGYLRFSEKTVDASLEAQARRGARACPECAITLVEADKPAA